MPIARCVATVSERNVLDDLVDATERLVGSLVKLGTNTVQEAQQSAPGQKVSSELRHARAIGQISVWAVTTKLKQALFPTAPLVDDPAPPASEAPPQRPPQAIPDYDNLSAAQIVPLLKGLTDAEREDVLLYEESTRHRKTILAALRLREA
jgi:hypothetical protein